MEVDIRTYREMLASWPEEDLVRSLGQLYHGAVHAIDSAIYSDREKQAWSPEPPGLDWTGRFRDAPPWIALVGERIIGFMNLQKDAHIDLAFVDPDFQRQGISGKLYRRLEQEARKRNFNHLTVDASHIARPFFEKQGFKVLRKNRVLRNGCVLINFSLEKALE